MSVFNALAIICFFEVASAKWTENTVRCPAIESLSNFDKSRFLGRWYATRNYPAGTENYVCRSSKFEKIDENRISSKDSGIDAITRTESEQSLTLKPYVLSEPTIFEVTYPGYKKPDLYILGTDYDSYVVFCRCRRIRGVYRFVDVTIHTRKREFRDSEIDKAFEVAENYGIERNSFMKLSQTNCP